MVLSVFPGISVRRFTLLLDLFVSAKFVKSIFFVASKIKSLSRLISVFCSCFLRCITVFVFWHDWLPVLKQLESAFYAHGNEKWND